MQDFGFLKIYTFKIVIEHIIPVKKQLPFVIEMIV